MIDASLRIKEIEAEVGYDPDETLEDILDGLDVSDFETFTNVKDVFKIEDTRLSEDPDIEFREEGE